MNSTLVFIIIAIIVIVILIIIGLRIWFLLSPLINEIQRFATVARKVVKSFDIVKNFTEEVAVSLLNAIIGDGAPFGVEILKLTNVNVVAVKRGGTLTEEQLKDLLQSNKRVVVTAIGKDSENAVVIANKLVDNELPVSLVTFDKRISSEIDDKIHFIDISSYTGNRGRSEKEADDVSVPENIKVKYYIERPSGGSPMEYIMAVNKGFL
jgi:hypothetical protein